MILNAKSAAHLLNFTPATVRRLAANHEIPGALIAGEWRFVQDDLIQAIRARYSRCLQNEKTAAFGGFDSVSVAAKFSAQPEPKTGRKPRNSNKGRGRGRGGLLSLATSSEPGMKP